MHASIVAATIVMDQIADAPRTEREPRESQPGAPVRFVSLAAAAAAFTAIAAPVLTQAAQIVA